MDKPKWAYKTPKRQFDWLNTHIKKIVRGYTMTGCDTADEWIELERSEGKKKQFPYRYLSQYELFEFSPGFPRGLLDLTYEGQRAEELSEEIDAWEKKHKTERAQYERLKKKFGETQ